MLFLHVTLAGIPTVDSKVADGELANEGSIVPSRQAYFALVAPNICHTVWTADQGCAGWQDLLSKVCHVDVVILSDNISTAVSDVCGLVDWYGGY